MKKSFCLFLASIIILLTSCSNFMNAGEIKKQIEEQIIEANAKTIKLVISQDTTMGSFLSSGEKECKLGYSIQVQFNLKKDTYIFKGLKAVSTNNAEESRNECVEFTTVENDTEKGIYKVSIKVVKDVSDILILPDCILIPGVEKDNCFPSFDASGWEQDSTIRIAFNKPVTTTEDFSVIISDTAGADMTTFYGTPYFSSDKKTLYIPVDRKSLILDPYGTTQTKDLFVKFDLTTIQDEEGNTGSGMFEYKFRINKSRDSEPPVLSSAAVFTSSAKTKSITSTSPDLWSDQGPNSGDYGANHIKDSVYIEFTGSDEGSGISGIFVKEKVLYYADGTQGNDTSKTYSKECTLDETTGKYFCNYTLGTLYNGIIELEIFAMDNSSTPSVTSNKFYVLSDNVIEAANIIFNEEIKMIPNTYDDLASSFKEINGDTQLVEITLHEDAKDYYFSNYYTNYELTAYWSYDENVINTPIQISNNVFSFERDVNKLVFIKIHCKDSVGNEKDIIKRMAPRPIIEAYDTSSGFEELFIKDNDLLRVFCKIPSENYNIFEYCKFVFTLEYQQNNETVIAKSIITEEGFPGFRYVFNNVFQSGRDEDGNLIYQGEPSQLEENIRSYLPCKVKGHVVLKYGDFYSPLSLDYIEGIYDVRSSDNFTVNDWINNTTPDDTTDDDPRLISLSTNDNYNLINNEYGSYINQTLTVKTQAITNSGCCKIIISDYKTPAGNSAGNRIKYKFIADVYNYDGTCEFDNTTLENTFVPNGQYARKKSQYESDSPEFVLPTPGIYKLYVEAIDTEANSNGKYDRYRPLVVNNDDPEVQQGFNFVITNDSQANSSELLIPEQPAGVDSSPILRLKADATPPTGKTFKYLSAATTSYALLLPEDGFNIQKEITQPSGLYKNANNKYELTYYYLINPSNSVENDYIYSLEELEKDYSSYKRTYEFDNDMIKLLMDYYKYIPLPYDNTYEGLYTLCIVIKDNAGNSKVDTYKCTNAIFGRLSYTKQAASQSGKSPKVIFTIPEGDNLTGIRYFYDQSAQCYRENSFEEHNQTFSIPSIDDLYPGEELTNEWYKMQISNSIDGFPDPNNPIPIPSRLGCSYIEYFYKGDTTCTRHNCLTGLSGYEIFCDKPTIAHTMYSMEKLTESKDSENAVMIWETKGMETSFAIHSENFTYGNENFKNIPHKAYYTTIIRFADGTIIMTDIEQKD